MYVVVFYLGIFGSKLKHFIFLASTVYGGVDPIIRKITIIRIYFKLKTVLNRKNRLDIFSLQINCWLF